MDSEESRPGDSVPDTAANAEQLRNDALNISHEDLNDLSDLDSAAASPINDKSDVRNLPYPILFGFVRKY